MQGTCRPTHCPHWTCGGYLNEVGLAGLSAITVAQHDQTQVAGRLYKRIKEANFICWIWFYAACSDTAGQWGCKWSFVNTNFGQGRDVLHKLQQGLWERHDAKPLLCHHLTTTVITCNCPRLFIYETESSCWGAAHPWSDRGSRGFGEPLWSIKALPYQCLFTLWW